MNSIQLTDAELSLLYEVLYHYEQEYKDGPRYAQKQAEKVERLHNSIIRQAATK